jgi:hypothetical protein
LVHTFLGFFFSGTAAFAFAGVGAGAALAAAGALALESGDCDCAKHGSAAKNNSKVRIERCTVFILCS